MAIRLTTTLIIEIAKEELTPEECKRIGAIILRKTGMFQALAQTEQQSFDSRREVAEWLKRLARLAETGGTA